MINIIRMIVGVCVFIVLPICMFATKKKNGGWNSALTRRFLILYGVVLAIGLATTLFDAFSGNPNTSIVRESPTIKRIVSMLKAVHSTDAEDGKGSTIPYYKLDNKGVNSDWFNAQKPYAVIGLKVEDDGTLSIASLTLYSGKSRNTEIKESDLEALQTIFFWLPAPPKTGTYKYPGQKSFKGYRESANLYMYDVKSGKLHRSVWSVYADQLPDTARSSPYTALNEKHFQTKVESIVASSDE